MRPLELAPALWGLARAGAVLLAEQAATGGGTAAAAELRAAFDSAGRGLAGRPMERFGSQVRPRTPSGPPPLTPRHRRPHA
jgi:hypothetical protein